MTGRTMTVVMHLNRIVESGVLSAEDANALKEASGLLLRLDREVKRQAEELALQAIPLGRG